MKFEDFFKKFDEVSNEKKVDTIGYLQKSCYDKTCEYTKCEDCLSCVSSNVTLDDLHDQIVSVCVSDDFLEDIAIDKKVIEVAIQNTIKSADAIKKNFTDAKERATSEVTPMFVEAIRRNLGMNVSVHTIMELLNSWKED